MLIPETFPPLHSFLFGLAASRSFPCLSFLPTDFTNGKEKGSIF